MLKTIVGSAVTLCAETAVRYAYGTCDCISCTVLVAFMVDFALYMHYV